MFVNSHLNKCTVHNGHEKGSAACTAVKQLPQRYSFLTRSCHTLPEDTLPPACPQPAVALPRTPSKPLQGSSLSFPIWTASKQLAALPVERQPFWNTGITYLTQGYLHEASSMTSILEQSKLRPNCQLKLPVRAPSPPSPAPQLIWV